MPVSLYCSVLFGLKKEVSSLTFVVLVVGKVEYRINELISVSSEKTLAGVVFTCPSSRAVSRSLLRNCYVLHSFWLSTKKVQGSNCCISSNLIESCCLKERYGDIEPKHDFEYITSKSG